MNILAFISLLFLLTSCGHCARQVANVKGFSRECIAGVSYLQFPSGVTVEYTKDGEVQPCE